MKKLALLLGVFTFFLIIGLSTSPVKAGCSGTATDCSAFGFFGGNNNPIECDAQQICSSNYVGCSGLTNCLFIFDEGACNAYTGCFWNSEFSECDGGPVSCNYEPNPNDCSLHGGCFAAYTCEGSVSACSSFPNSTSCSAQDGCSWSASSLLISIVSPQNISYNTTSIPLQVTANDTINSWWYSLNGGVNITFSPNTTITATQGNNNIIVYANNSDGNMDSKTVGFFVDSISPNIIITSPQNISYNTVSIQLNVTANEAINAWRYSLNGGTNTTFTPNITITAMQGINNIRVWANDSYGNLNNSIIYFFVDSISPTVTIYSPQNISYNTTSIALQVSANEVINIWRYSLNGGANTTFTPNKAYGNSLALSNRGWSGGYYFFNINDANFITNNTFTLGIYARDVYINVTINGILVFNHVYVSDGEVHFATFTNSTMIPISSPFQINISYNGTVSGNHAINTGTNCGNFTSCGNVNTDEANIILAYITGFNTIITGIFGSNNIIVYASDSSGNIGNSSIYFSVNTTPTINLIFKNPVDIDFDNLYNNTFTIIYNISDDFAINSSTVKLFYNVTTGLNCWTNVNGSQDLCGTQQLLNVSNSSTNWTFVGLTEEEIYPATYQIDETIMENTTHSVYNLTSNTNFLKIALFNVSNSTPVGEFELMANDSGVPSSNLRIYYCNDSYTTGSPVTSLFCTNFYNLPETQDFSHNDSAFSRHMLIPFTMNVTTGEIGNVKITSHSYFLLRGNTTSWNIFYLPIDSGTTQFSNDTGTSWTDWNMTIDAHLHQYSGNDTFFFYAQACNIYGNCANSSVGLDLLQVGGLAPTSPNVMIPANLSYRRTINISYLSALSPNGFPIIIYNISLVNSDFTFNETIVLNNSPNLYYPFDSTTVPDAQYRVQVRACDNQSMCSNGFSEVFTVDNTNPIVILYSPQNINYTIVNIPLQVSANEPINLWVYSLNGEANQSFSPNITIMASQGVNSIVIYAVDTTGNIGASNAGFFVDSIAPDINIIIPFNGSTSSNPFIFWNASLDSIPNSCLLSINNSANISITIDGNNCHYNSTNLTQGTYCGLIYANDSFGNVGVSGTNCATFFIPHVSLIDNLGQFGFIGAMVMGAGILLFLIDGFFGSIQNLLQDPKKLVVIIIGAVILVAMVSVFF